MSSATRIGDPDPAAPGAASESLRPPRRLGAVAITFFVIAAAAPLIGMTGSVPVSILLGNGPAVPGAFLAVGIVLLLFSVGYATMSSHVTNAGAFFAYVGRGLGIVPGVGSAFVSLVAYVTVQLAVLAFFGAVAGGQAADRFGIEAPWYVWSFLAWAVALALSLLNIDVGATVLGVLMLAEVASLVVFAVGVLAQGGADGIDLAASFDPQAIFAGGFAGASGIALAFAFASFIGFEATAIFGEEAKDPKRTVPAATYLAVVTITVLFVAASLALVTGLGASQAADRVVELSSVEGVPLADPSAVLFSLAGEYVGTWLADVMSWLVLSSLFAAVLALQNTAGRYFFTLGRARVLPAALARTLPSGAPVVGSVVTSVITGVVVAVFAARGSDPILTLFYWMAAVAVVAIVLVEALVCVAVIAYFRRRDSEDRRPWQTVIAPALALVGLLVGEYLLVSRFGLLAGTVAEGIDPSAQPWGLNALGWFLISLPLLAFVVGAVIGAVRRGHEDEAAVRDLVS